jgi:zinc and cadmium transporter
MEISPFLGTLLWNIVIAIGIVVVVSIIKLIKDKLNTYLEYITATTVWLLLGIIFLWFLPELSAEGSLDWKDLWIFILLWVFLFYLLELFLHWHHCKDLWHQDSCHSHHNHEHKNWIMMFWWTLLHNIFHWIVLFWAFAIDMHFWIATTVAILLHSIPQNIVNYIMNHNNIKYSYFAAFWWIIWALLTFPFSGFLLENKFYILAIITWWLLYTALADIFPEFNGKANISKKIAYLFFIFIWIFLFIWFEELTHHEHNEEHEKHELHEEHDDNKYKHDKEEKIEEINNKESKLPNTKIERVCFENNWKRITWTRECEGIWENICKQIWGKFNSCASACRNNPEAKICTMQCVQVCKF